MPVPDRPALDHAAFAAHLERWDLVPDGPPLVTHSSRLLPVLFRGEVAMLKVTGSPEEVRGGQQLRWWDGMGAARVLASHEGAFLLERATGTRSAGRMSRADDDAATRVLCAVAAQLHAPRPRQPPELEPLPARFTALAGAARHGGLFAVAHETASALLSAPREVTPLHGDLHHGNVLDFGARGWLAIDPKGLIGERTFDFANIFCNPDPLVALTPGRVARLAAVVAHEAHVERERLLSWVVAWCGLSAAWHLEDGQERRAELPLTVGHEALAALHIRGAPPG